MEPKSNPAIVNLSDAGAVRDIARNYSARDHIMDVAQDLAMTRGVNSFSYNDIAEIVGIKAASIHYHFSKKEDLLNAVIDRYLDRYRKVLNEIDDTMDSSKEKLRNYMVTSLNCTDNALRISLCSMMATDYLTLPAGTQKRVQEFIRFNEQWVEKVLKEGKKSGELDLQLSVAQSAKLLYGSIEGCIITAHAFPEEQRISSLPTQLLKLLSA